MSDLISRQTAIDAVQGIGRLAILPDNDAVVRMSAVEYVLFNLPSAQPEPLKITIDHTPTADEMERIKQAMRITPVIVFPSEQPGIKPVDIDYYYCSNAMLKMWIDNVLTDGEYNKIMDKLNDFELRRREKENG